MSEWQFALGVVAGLIWVAVSLVAGFLVLKWLEHWSRK